MQPQNKTMKKDYLYKIFGGLMILTFLGLTFFEYERVLSPIPDFVAKGRYIDYSILVYLSCWIIYLLLFLAGAFTFFKSKIKYLFLLIFSSTTLLEIYVNESFYIVKTISNYPKYILLSISLVSLVAVGSHLFKTRKINFSEIFLSLILAITIVYLPNALITFYF